MLPYAQDIDRIANEALLVTHICSAPVQELRFDTPVVEARAWMVGNDFDVAPIRGPVGELKSYILRDQLADLPPSDSIQEHGERTGKKRLVESTTSLAAGLKLLSELDWFFVVEGDEVVGIVTGSDLARPAVAMYLFAKLLTLERGLRRLAGSYGGIPIPDTAAEGSDDDYSTLSQVVNAARRQGGLVEDLGFPSKSKFDEALKPAIRLRNNLAHGRSVLHSDKTPAESVALALGVDKVLGDVQELIAERGQIWQAFESTLIRTVRVEVKHWVGPSPAELPFEPPVFVITAANPSESVRLPEENARRNDALRALLESRGAEFVEVEGTSPDGAWSEPSFMVGGLNRRQACELAGRFGQRALFELDHTHVRVLDVKGDEHSGAPRRRTRIA